MSEINLGFTYRDAITGFQGVATAFATYISGCNQALLAPPIDGNGAWRDPQWFDVQRLTPILSAGTVVLDNGDTPGCDRAAPKR